MTTSAASGSELIDSEIEGINASITEGITLDAAPLYPVAPLISQNGISYTSWELIHRMPMLAGFEWTGPIAEFITPQMYIGTPLAGNHQYLGQTLESISPYTETLMNDPTTYSECIQSESYLSYGLGERIESTDIKELKAIAKACAKKFYGSYFDGKSYTTREEYLMMLFTMFGEDVGFAGEFTTDGTYREAGTGFESHFTNISATSWYAPYLGRAYDLALIPSDESSWTVAQEISDTEAIDILAIYTAYRMDFAGDVFDQGIITTENLQYHIAFPTDADVMIRVQ